MSELSVDHITQVNATLARGVEPDFHHLVVHCAEAFGAVDAALHRVRRLMPSIGMEIEVSPYVMRARKILSQRKVAETATQQITRKVTSDEQATQAA